MTATEKRQNAEKALNKAKDAEIATIVKANAEDEAARVKEDLADVAERDANVAKANAIFTGDVADSKRVKVTVEYKFEDRKDRIRCGAVVMKNDVPKAELFRIPVGVEVELPVEVISQLKGRKIQRYRDGELVFVNQLVVSTVG